MSEKIISIGAPSAGAVISPLPVQVMGGELKILEPVSTAGDYIDLRAEMDCLAALSACSVDIGKTNAGKLKPLRVQILDAED